MPSPSPGGPTGGDPLELIANLSSLLEQVVKAPGELPSPHFVCLLSNPPLYSFSDCLLHALLEESSRVPPSADELLSFISQNRVRIPQSLETVSLQCLAVYLLIVPGNGFELGLHLLMDEPEYISNSHLLQNQLSVPDPEHFAPFIHKRLIHEAFRLFTQETGQAGARRMAGKVLAEIVHDSSENCHKLVTLDGENDPRPVIKTLINILTDPDVVLSFFSNTTLRAIYHSGISDESNLESDGLQSMINNRVQTQGDGIQQFCSYLRADRHHSPNVRARPRLDNVSSIPPAHYVVESDIAHGMGLLKGPVLLVFGAEGLNLINCSANTSDWKANYTFIQLTDTTQIECTFSNEDGEVKQFLSLHIHAEDLVVINDQKRELRTINIIVASEDDLTMVLKKLETAGIRCRARSARASSKRPRSSSIVIPLDAEEDIVPNSFQSPEIPALAGTSLASHHVHWRNESANMVQQFEYVPEPATENGSQSSLTELTRTPTVHETSSTGRQSPNLTSPRFPAADQPANRTSEDPCSDSADEDGNKENEKVPFGGNTQTTAGTSSQGERDPSEDGPARNTRSRSSFKEKSLRKSNALKPIPPNTQESLIFPKRRSRGKSYTAPTKTSVDWDEDLRASDASAGPVSKEDGELTSVSSPSSNNAPSSFKQRLQTRRGDSARKKAAAKTKARRTTRRKGKNKKRTRGQAKHSSPPDESTQSTCHESIEPADISGDDLEHAAVVDPPPTDTGPLKKSDAIDDLSQDNPGITVLSDEQINDENNQGRGQTVAEKLIAAFRGSGTPESQPDVTRLENHWDIEPEVEATHETLDIHKEHIQDKLHAKNRERMVEMPDMQDLPGSLTSNQGEVEITDDEIYPVEIYSGGPSDESQNSHSHNHEDQDWDARKRKSMFSGEGEQESKRARRTSSLLTTSSVEPRSKNSTPEAYYTSPSPDERSRITSEHAREAASTRKLLDFGLAGPLLGKHDHSTGSLGQVLNHTDYTSGGIIFREYDTWVTRDDDTGAAPPTTNADRPANGFEDNSKSIVDRNGSPRLRQPLDPAKKEHVVQKRRGAFPIVEQRSPKRIKGINQVDTILGVDDEMQAEIANPRGMKDCQTTLHTGVDGRFKENTPATLEQAVTDSRASFAASHTSADTGRRSPFLFRVRRSSRASATGLPGPETRQGQSRADESIAHAPSTWASVAGKSHLQGAGFKRKVSFELSRPAGQNDWQTSLQKLHKGMERTLLNNSEQLSRQIEGERTTVNRVLNTYREQCHTVLDQVFQAQMERIRLCKQQMDSVKEQHADVCQGLIRFLEENERSLKAAGGSP